MDAASTPTAFQILMAAASTLAAVAVALFLFTQKNRQRAVEAISATVDKWVAKFSSDITKIQQRLTLLESKLSERVPKDLRVQLQRMDDRGDTCEQKRAAIDTRMDQIEASATAKPRARAKKKD